MRESDRYDENYRWNASHGEVILYKKGLGAGRRGVGKEWVTEIREDNA